MISLHEMLSGLYGAWRLVRLDPGGMRYFNDTVDGFWHSFYAAALVAPLVIAMLAVQYSNAALVVPAWRIVSIESVKYVMLWVAFPMVMVGLARALKRTEAYIPYIVAYNWATVWQNVVFVPVLIVLETGIVTGGPADVIRYGAMTAVLAYIWVVTRVALGVGGGVAAMLVAVDLALSYAINVIGAVLIQLG